MRFSTAFAVAGFAGASLAKDITVGVGNANGNLIFNPNNIEAAEGDTVWFKFWPKNHSVAQATFANPCQPMENGFWSGFVPTTDNTKAAEQTYMIEITNASAPIWFYCTQGQHCQNGMVGVINPPYVSFRLYLLDFY
jgi:plastocyanin